MTFHKVLPEQTDLPVLYRSSKHFFITETRLFKYIENFTFKNGKFSDKNSDISHISAQNIDCGYSLEPTIYVFEQK